MGSALAWARKTGVPSIAYPCLINKGR